MILALLARKQTRHRMPGTAVAPLQHTNVNYRRRSTPISLAKTESADDMFIKIKVAHI